MCGAAVDGQTYDDGVSLVLVKEIDDWSDCDNILALPPPDEDDDGFVCHSIVRAWRCDVRKSFMMDMIVGVSCCVGASVDHRCG